VGTEAVDLVTGSGVEVAGTDVVAFVTGAGGGGTGDGGGVTGTVAVGLLLTGMTGVGSGSAPVAFLTSGSGGVVAAGAGARGVVALLTVPGKTMGSIGPDSFSLRVAGLFQGVVGAAGMVPVGGLLAPVAKKLGSTAVFVAGKGVVTGTDPVGGLAATGAAGVTLAGGSGVEGAGAGGVMLAGADGVTEGDGA
jgi:hypothetical protein